MIVCKLILMVLAADEQEEDFERGDSDSERICFKKGVGHNKKIVLKKINYPSVTLKRLVKYMRQGYDINDTDVMMLAKSFRGFKEPKGVLDEHFGIDGFAKKSTSNDDYKSLGVRASTLTLGTP